VLILHLTKRSYQEGHVINQHLVITHDTLIQEVRMMETEGAKREKVTNDKSSKLTEPRIRELPILCLQYATFTFVICNPSDPSKWLSISDTPIFTTSHSGSVFKEDNATIYSLLSNLALGDYADAVLKSGTPRQGMGMPSGLSSPRYHREHSLARYGNSNLTKNSLVTKEFNSITMFLLEFLFSII